MLLAWSFKQIRKMLAFSLYSILSQSHFFFQSQAIRYLLHFSFFTTFHQRWTHSQPSATSVRPVLLSSVDWNLAMKLVNSSRMTIFSSLLELQISTPSFQKPNTRRSYVNHFMDMNIRQTTKLISSPCTSWTWWSNITIFRSLTICLRTNKNPQWMGQCQAPCFMGRTVLWRFHSLACGAT